MEGRGSGIPRSGEQPAAPEIDRDRVGHRNYLHLQGKTHELSHTLKLRLAHVFWGYSIYFSNATNN